MAVETADVDSSMLSGASYDADAETLTVQMNNGRTYSTNNITPEQWQEFMDSPSKGSWYRTNVMGLTR